MYENGKNACKEVTLLENIGAKVKKLRQEKNLTLREMSEKINLSTGYLSQFERGITTIAVEYLYKISDILGVSINYFFSESEPADSIVLRSYEQSVSKILNQCVYRSLSHTSAEKNMAPEIVELLPAMGKPEVVKVYPHEGEEFVYVLQGVLTLLFEDEEYHLYPGDSAHYLSDTPHNWMNETNDVVKILVVHSQTEVC